MKQQVALAMPATAYIVADSRAGIAQSYSPGGVHIFRRLTLPPSNTRFLGPTRVDNQNGISIGSAVMHDSLI